MTRRRDAKLPVTSWREDSKEVAEVALAAISDHDSTTLLNLVAVEKVRAVGFD